MGTKKSSISPSKIDPVFSNITLLKSGWYKKSNIITPPAPLEILDPAPAAGILAGGSKRPGSHQPGARPMPGKLNSPFAAGFVGRAQAVVGAEATNAINVAISYKDGGVKAPGGRGALLM